MVKRLVLLWVALSMPILAYGQPMDWGQEGFGPRREGPDLRGVPTAFSEGKGDSLNVRCIGRWPFGAARAVVVEGDYVYLGSGGVIYILDMSDPTSPTEVGEIATPGVVFCIFVDNFHLYVADGGGGLRVIDVADPAHPYEVGSYDTPGSAIGVWVSGSYAYVVSYETGLRIINVADPANPYEVGHCDTPDDARGVCVLGSYAYVADGGAGLRVVDMADPAHPEEVGSYDTPGYAVGVWASGSYAYVTGGSYGLRVIDVADPAHPSEAGSYDTPGWACGVYVSGSYAYVADEDSGLRVIDVADPAHPSEVGSYDTPGYAYGVYVLGSYAYVADANAGLRVIDVSDPAHPSEVGSYDTPGWARGVYISGSCAYVADYRDGLRVIDVSDPANPYEEGYCDTPGSAKGVYVMGSYAYVADGDSGLRIINVADPANPYEVGSYDTPGYASGVYVLGSYAYIADADSGLRVINVADPASPYEVGYYDTPGYADGVYVSGSYAYVADWSGGLRIINVADPANPYEVGYYDTPGRARGVYVLGSYAYIADVDSGLRIINVADPAHPSEVGSYDTPGYAYGIYVLGSYAYVADGGAGLRVVDVADPANPYEEGYCDTPGSAKGVYVMGSYAYVADFQAGLVILQFYGDQVGTIAGTVEDAPTQDPIEGAFVEAMQGENIIGSDNTGSDGSYSIPNLPPGTYNVRASKDGYETKTENGKEVIIDQTTTVDFQLNPSPSDTLFFDDFADGNDDGWQKYGGCTWAVENEEYTSSVSGSEVWCLSVAGNSDWTDYILEANVYGDAGVDKVVAFRVVDENNFYAVNVRSDWMGADEVTLSRIVDGVSTEILTTDYPSQLNTWYHVQVKLIGDNIKVRVDDNLVIDYTDTGTPLDHGQIAVTAYSGAYGSATVRFDNVLVAWPYPEIVIQNLSPLYAGIPITIDGKVQYSNGQPYSPPGGIDLGVEDPISWMSTTIDVGPNGEFTYTTQTGTDTLGLYAFRFFLPTEYGEVERILVLPIMDEQDTSTYNTIYEVTVGALGDTMDSATNAVTKRYVDYTKGKASIPLPTPRSLWNSTKALGKQMTTMVLNAGKRWFGSSTNKGALTAVGVSCGAMAIPATQPVSVPLCVGTSVTAAGTYSHELLLEAIYEIIDDLNVTEEEKTQMKEKATAAKMVASVISAAYTGGIYPLGVAATRMLEYGVRDPELFDVFRAPNPKTLQTEIEGFSIIAFDSLGDVLTYGVYPFEERTCIVRSYCPVDLIVTDPLGRVVNKDTTEIPGARYTEFDFDCDGGLEDEILIPAPEIGEFNVQVVPDSTATPTDSFSLIVDYTYCDTTLVLAQDVQIQDIPPEPFTFETFENLPPDTFSLFSPQDSTTVPLPVTFDWNDAIDPNPGHDVFYDLYLSLNSDFSDSIVLEGLTQSECTLDSLPTDSKDGTPYYWKVRAYDAWQADTFSNQIWVVNITGVGVGDQNAPDGLPKEFSLSQNYPNPFNPVTQIKYALPRDCWVRLNVYNILGQKIASLVDGEQKAGYKTVRWDAGSFSSGIYFYRISAGDFTSTRKMVLLR